MWDTFKWRISLSIGMLMHLGGKLDEALTWYGICMSHVESSHKDPEGYDTKSIALINAAIIYCGDRHFDLQRVKSIQMEVKSRYPSSTMTPNITCALHILDSWTVEGLMLARYFPAYSYWKDHCLSLYALTKHGFHDLYF